jgi:hypothetical protein
MTSPPSKPSLPSSLLNLAAIRQERERRRCAADVVYWLDTYGWTYDPRLKEAFLRFHPFPRQEEFLRWLGEREWNQEDGLAEKSRDVGFTWLCAAYALHGWLFRPGFQCGFGSRKLSLVDTKGDPSSILEKVRLMLRRLPEWQLPAGFKWSEHDNTCRLLNPATGAAITGEGGDEIGRGARTTLYFVDEAAFLERPEGVEAALSATTNCRIWVSTPNGQGNPFYRKRFSGDVPVFTFHWRDDPRKDDAWYAAMKKKLGDPVVIAQELDIDYAASVEGICIPAAWVRAAVNLTLAAGPSTVAGFDVSDSGRDRSVVIARRGPVVLPPVDWGQLNTTQSAHRAADEAERLGAAVLHYDCIGVGAGIKGTYASTERRLRFRTHAVNVGAAPSETAWPDGKTSKERFLNLRAELWWLLRTRCEKTYERVEEGVAHPDEECISLPDHPQLLADLSLPLYQRTESGKIKLESKADMARRGVKSPDYGDALALTMAPEVVWEAFSVYDDDEDDDEGLDDDDE